MASKQTSACVEAITANPAGMTITRVASGPDGQPVEQLVDVLAGINGGVYADVPLDPAGPVDIRFQFQQGAVAETRAITWSATNILNGGQLSLRAGDALRLTAHDPALPAAGTFTLTDTLAPASRPPLPGTITSHLPVTPATAPVAWPDQNLTLLAAATGTLQGAWIPAATPAVACHIASDGSSATMQLQFFDGTYTKVAKIRIDKTPAGLTAHQLYAKYKSGNALGQNFDSIPSSAAPAGSTGYGVTAVALTFLHGQAGTTTLTPAGGTPSTDPHAVTFTTPGIHTLAATWTPADGGQASTATLVVTAHAASFGAPLDVLTFNRQAWKLPGIGPDLTVEADAALAWNETTTPGQLPRTFTVDTYQTGPRHVLARIPGSNAIAARGIVIGFDIGFADRTDDAAIADILPDGSRVFRFTLTSDGLPAGFSIKLSTYYQGATFADGGREKILTAADFDDNGIATVEVFWGPDGEPRICHRATVTGPGGQIYSSENKELYNPLPKNSVKIEAPEKMRVNDNHDNKLEMWDKESHPIDGEKDLSVVTMTAINCRNEPAMATFYLSNPGKLSPQFWNDPEKREMKSMIYAHTLPPNSGWQQKFHVEGIEPSTSIKDVIWDASITYGDPVQKDTTVYQMDMDVDSNNNGIIGDEDEKIEESLATEQPGKAIVTGRFKDSDGDAVPDFADGMGIAGGLCNDEKAKLTPMTVELKTPIKPEDAEVIFDYGAIASIPRLGGDGDIVTAGAGTSESPHTYHLSRTGMRIWAVDAHERNGTLAVGQDVPASGAKFIPPGKTLKWADIAKAANQSPTSRSLTLYLEYATSEAPPIPFRFEETVGKKAFGCKEVAPSQSAGIAFDKVNVCLLPFDIEKASLSEGQFVVNVPDACSGTSGILDLIFKKQGGGEIIVRTNQNQAPGKVSIALDEILTGAANTPLKPFDNQDAARCDKIYARLRVGIIDVVTGDRLFDDVQINGQTVKVASVEVLAKRKISNYFSPEWNGAWSGTMRNKGSYRAGEWPNSLANIDVAGKLLDALDPANEGLAMDGNTVIRDRYRPAQDGFPQVTALNGAASIQNEADTQGYTAGYICKPDVDQDNASSPQVTLLRAPSVAVKYRSGGGTDADRLTYDDMVYIPDIPDVHLRTVDDTGGLHGNRDQIDVWRGQGDETLANTVRSYFKPASTCLKVIPVAAP